MTLDARLQRLEDALNAGPNQRIEQECYERMKFNAKLMVWSQFTDLSEAQQVSLEQAQEALKALPSLPKHRCTPAQPMDDETRERLRCLFQKALAQSMIGAVHLRGDKEGTALWAKFAPHVPPPWRMEHA